MQTMPKTKYVSPRHPETPDAGRRPIRPIDREKMRPWLERILDKGEVSGVKWVGEDRCEFEIPWRHAARHGWSREKDACVFERWARHTKKYLGEGDHADPKRWKANFRCALHSLPDLERVDGVSSRGSQAVRRYRFLPQGDNKKKAAKVKRARRVKVEEERDEEVFQEDEVKVEEDVSDSPKRHPSLPDFEKILDAAAAADTAMSSGGSSEPLQLTLPNNMAGCRVVEYVEPASPTTSPESAAGNVSPHSEYSGSDSEGSHYSDEDAVEFALRLETEGCDIGQYNPKLWTPSLDFDMDIAEEVELPASNPEEVRTFEVVTVEQPQYWELTHME